jgi:hypothetical protein
VRAERTFTAFRAFRGKASPVHFFWGSFDLAVTRLGVPIPLASAIFAPIELALVLQSRQFALRAPANRGGAAKALRPAWDADCQGRRAKQVMLSKVQLGRNLGSYVEVSSGIPRRPDYRQPPGETMRIASAAVLYPSRGGRYRTANSSLALPVSIALERAAAKAWAHSLRPTRAT